MDHVKDLKIAITAGASGIGSEVAIALSKAGAEVMICDADEAMESGSIVGNIVIEI